MNKILNEIQNIINNHKPIPNGFELIQKIDVNKRFENDTSWVHISYIIYENNKLLELVVEDRKNN